MFRVVASLLVAFSVALAEETCKDAAKSEIKIELLKESLNQVKNFLPSCKEYEEGSGKCSGRGSALAHMELAIDALEGLGKEDGATKGCPKCPDSKGGPADCLEILQLGHTKSGVYTIYPRHRINGTYPLRVYCDMETDGGGWTVFQRRDKYPEQTDFYLKWNDYKEGFGNIEKEFWLGNEHIFTITNQGVYTLRMDMKSYTGEYRYSAYSTFYIKDEKSSYTLYVQDFSGNASNDFPNQHNFPFTTLDHPNPCRNLADQCPQWMHGAWWYPCADCGLVNLNALYNPGVNGWTSNYYYYWTGFVGLSFSEMKIRPTNYKPRVEH